MTEPPDLKTAARDVIADLLRPNTYDVLDSESVRKLEALEAALGVGERLVWERPNPLPKPKEGCLHPRVHLTDPMTCCDCGETLSRPHSIQKPKEPSVEDPAIWLEFIADELQAQGRSTSADRTREAASEIRKLRAR